MIKRFLFTIMTFLSIVASAAKPAGNAAPTLHAAIPEGLAAPLLMENNPNKLEGLLPDYMKAIGDALGRKTSLTLLTRYRITNFLLSGKSDVLCYSSRAWAEDKGQLNWSKTLFMKREVILGPSPMPAKLSELGGKTIGTILYYVYPRLDPLFNSHRITREDASSEEANLNKIVKGRIQYVVTDEIFLDYFKLKNPKIEEGRSRLFLQEYPIQCSVSRLGTVNVKDLDKAIEKVKSSGQLEALFKKYGATVH